jgi:hypothetical protein
MGGVAAATGSLLCDADSCLFLLLSVITAKSDAKVGLAQQRFKRRMERRKRSAIGILPLVTKKLIAPTGLCFHSCSFFYKHDVPAGQKQKPPSKGMMKACDYRA